MFCNRNYPDRLYSGFFRRTLFVFLFQNVGFTLSSLLCNQLYPDTGTYGALEKIDSEESKWRNGAIIIANIVAFAVPFLYVSRFQFLFEIGVAAVIYILVNKNMRKSTLILLGLVVCAAYVVITLSQKRDAIYLNNVFKMKYTHMPVFLTQPYIYIANNYDNFDCLVKNLPKFSYGLRMLFPFVSLTGLKFVMPNLVPATVYLTSTELTTFTMFYDAYYDFGVIGVFVIALLIGVVAKVIIDIIKKSDNPVVYLFYGQIAVYLALAFLQHGSAVLRHGSG